jgi:hypothetical protein
VNDTLRFFEDQVKSATSRSFWEMHDTQANNPNNLSPQELHQLWPKLEDTTVCFSCERIRCRPIAPPNG